ncbi:TPA: helix-turn-helix domain-containing protein, partial [Streptococcus suis]
MALNNKISTIYNNSKVAYNLLMDLLEVSKSIGSEIPNHTELAKKYIDSNYSLPTINLDGVAEEIGVSKFHLAREFHKKFGITVNNYLTTIRIEQACRLLKQK